MSLNGSLKKLPRPFYLRPTVTVANELLGKYLVRRVSGAQLVGKIVEVEAYLGAKDPASHTYRGKTKRNEVMFKEGGCLYVYFTYGMYFCSNVVTEEEGIGHAVLLRAVEPVEGVQRMLQFRRANGSGNIEKNLTNGPAKLCQAFSLQRKENGTDLLGDEIFITEGEEVRPSQIKIATRIGIRVAVERKLRFYLKENVWVSKL